MCECVCVFVCVCARVEALVLFMDVVQKTKGFNDPLRPFTQTKAGNTPPLHYLIILQPQVFHEVL